MIQNNLMLTNINTTIAVDHMDDNAFVSNIESFIKQVKEKNKLPLHGVDICFFDDLWDFTSVKNINMDNVYFRFNFSKAPGVFKNILKEFVLILLLENHDKINAIYTKFISVSSFLSYAENNNIFKLDDITVDFLEKWTKTLNNLKITTQYGYQNILKSFFLFYNASYQELFSKSHFEVLDNIDEKYYKAVQLDRKTPSIPEDFFDNTLSAAIKTMNDSKEKSFFRGMSAMLVILSQTGLRSGELFALKAGCLKTINAYKDKNIYYLEYETWKKHRGNASVSVEITYVNELTKQAYDLLMVLYSEKRKTFELPYLFLDMKGLHEKSSFPITPSRSSSLFKELFRYYNRYFTTILSSPSTDRKLPTAQYKTGHGNIEYIIKPSCMQFRVHMCTSLYEKGVPIEYIERFMSHLSNSMTCYYVRPHNTVQEDMDIAINTLKEIVTGQVKPLGTGKGLIEKINEFIRANNYNVEKDLETICSKLAQNIPIRIKTGGVCIKSSKWRECSKDSLTNEFYCAYGVCPNIYTFYYMVDVAYQQALDLVECIQINQRHNHIKQIQKEKNMLHTILESKLIPQICDLKERIENIGVEKIIYQHPNIYPF